MESYYICKTCIWCQKPLTKIGNARANGKSHDDWPGRNTHKKCWLENEVQRQLKRPTNSSRMNRMKRAIDVATD